MKKSLVKVCTSFFFYFLCNHWLSCCFFMIHRYIEYNHSNTWAIYDGLASFDVFSGTHNICSRSVYHCYARSIYFVISTLSSVGYGDIFPCTNIEYLFQIFFVTLTGVCLNALVCSSFHELWASLDNASSRAYRKHLRAIDHYVKYRKLSSKERNAIVGNFEFLWTMERQSGGYETNFISRSISLYLGLNCLDYLLLLPVKLPLFFELILWNRSTSFDTFLLGVLREP
jgi:hypothetical protein